jgi:hypothetical protein
MAMQPEELQYFHAMLARLPQGCVLNALVGSIVDSNSGALPAVRALAVVTRLMAEYLEEDDRALIAQELTAQLGASRPASVLMRRFGIEICCAVLLVVGCRKKTCADCGNVQAVFCRRRHQPTRPPLANTNAMPGRPTAGMGVAMSTWGDEWP